MRRAHSGDRKVPLLREAAGDSGRSMTWPFLLFSDAVTQILRRKLIARVTTGAAFKGRSDRSPAFGFFPAANGDQSRPAVLVPIRFMGPRWLHAVAIGRRRNVLLQQFDEFAD